MGLCECIFCVDMPAMTGRGHQICWGWSYRRLWATLWVLRIEPRSSGRENSALNHLEIFLPMPYFECLILHIIYVLNIYEKIHINKWLSNSVPNLDQQDFHTTDKINFKNWQINMHLKILDWEHYFMIPRGKDQLARHRQLTLNNFQVDQTLRSWIEKKSYFWHSSH